MSLFFGKASRTGFISGKYYSVEMFILLLLLIFVWIFSIWWKRKYGWKSKILPSEGFSQDRSYVLNQSSIYDDFYVEIYDSLMLSGEMSSYTWNAFKKAVQPYSSAKFLDVGSGTGSMVHTVATSGYSCIGVDTSEAMIRHSSEKYPTLEFLRASVMDPMLFQRDAFFGVFCLGMTVYEWTDSQKFQFFKNSYFWIRPGGYLLLHLVDVEHFSSDVPSHGSFKGFSYRNSIDMADDSSNVGLDSDSNMDSESSSCSCSVRRETFVDLATGNVRENEMDLYLLPEKELLRLAQRAGFLMAGKWNLGSSVYKDKYQYLYLLERSL